VSTTTPIADLTYRNYEGPMNSTDMRWWAIARMTMKTSFTRRGFITWACFSAWYYVIAMAIFYFMGVFQGQGVDPMRSIVWRDQILTGYGMSQLLLFAISLLIGAGVIANDNRANALLIYLSKPCTKRDYLAGKWLGLFAVYYAVSVAPLLFFWCYTAMSFRDYGSISSAPWMPLQILVLSAIPACSLASLSVGISSLFNQGRVAGATFAGIYFMSNIFTKMIGGLLLGTGNQSVVLRDFSYASVDGLNIGLGKILLHTDGSNIFAVNAPTVPRPDLAPILFGYVALCVISVLVAWVRIRPVEVIG
jgi:ABC-2 type transport system permease protein